MVNGPGRWNKGRRKGGEWKQREMNEKNREKLYKKKGENKPWGRREIEAEEKEVSEVSEVSEEEDGCWYAL